jgi:hypothetical protein
MTKNKKSVSIVEDAEKASLKLLDQVSISRIAYRKNAEHLIALCRELVTARPIQEPVAPRVAEIGQIRYPKFPASQSLLNRYGSFLRIWRKAFYEIASVTAPKQRHLAEKPMIDEEDLARMPAGTRANVELLIVLINEQVRENNRLKEIVKRGNTPAGVLGKGASGQPIRVEPLARWLKELGGRNHYLTVDDLGVRISRSARSNVLIMEAEVFNILVKLAG